MGSVSLIDGHIDEPKKMTTEKAIRMIDEYLTEPHSINKKWVECLMLCREALVDSDRQKAEIERLQAMVEREREKYEITMDKLKETLENGKVIYTNPMRRYDPYTDSFVKEMVGE